MLKASAALNYPIDDTAYTAALSRNNVDGAMPYDNATGAKAIDLSIADLALTLIFSVKKLMDDGYTVELADIAELWRLRRFYRHRWGLPDDEPVDKPIIIKDASMKW